MFLPACSSAPQEQVCIEENCFNVEVAQTLKEIAQGLQYRESLENDRGMLFIFRDSSILSFWMKDTLIPLDIIWIDQTGEIVFIEENVPPCESDPCLTYSPPFVARYVLEINAGEVEMREIIVGETVTFRL